MGQFLREMFAANRIIILFVYGQAFFVLALAIALRSWRHSRLALARSLRWLAAFGFTHALYEWGDVFIPLQQQYMPAPLIDLLRSAQSLLLAISFACLFQFGIEALRPLPGRRRWLRYLPVAALIVWFGWAFGPALSAARDLEHWYSSITIWARYGLGFPGALLAAYGLWHQAHRLAADLHIPQTQRQLKIAALAMASYSMLSGLVVRPGPFFPARWLNTTQLENVVLVPVPVFRGLLGVILTVAIIRSLEVFQVELDRRLIRMEEAQVLSDERDRIGREIHDGTLQTIYAAGLLLQTVERDATRAGAPLSSGRIQQSIELLNQAVADMRGYIGALRSAPTSRSLAAGLHDLTGDRSLRSLVEVDLALDIPEAQALAPAQIGHLLAITHEALSNVARHAQATRVRLAAVVRDGRLHLEIQDNGHGLPVDYVVGYGLRNMRDRARMLGGELTIETQPGQGTTINVNVPWSVENERLATTLG